MDNRLIHYEILSSCENVKAFTTLRNTLQNELPRFSSGSSPDSRSNRRQLAEILEMEPDQLIFPRQTHSNHVTEVHATPVSSLEHTDGLVTNIPGICLCVQTADCVPILLYDPRKKAIAAIHAGWRGTVGEIACAAVDLMQKNCKSSPEHMLAVIGPSIGPEVYEVGKEVIEKVERTIPDPESALQQNNRGKYHLNLWEANRQLLIRMGIPPGHIEMAGACTFTESDRFYSARREGKETGRMVSGIMLT